MIFMFVNYLTLKSLNVSNFDTSKVTRMYGMFGGCSNLTSLNINNFNTESLTDMDYFLAECTSLTSIDLSSFTTENISTMTGIFSDSINLKYIDISNFGNSTDYIDLFEGLFENVTIVINDEIKDKLNISELWHIIIPE